MTSTDEFSSPASAVGITWNDLNGRLLLFTVHAQETDVQTNFGPANPIRADVVVLDGDQAGESYDDTLVFPKALIGQLKPRIGGKVLGRLGQGAAKPGQSPPWLLHDATDEDKKVGRDWLSKNAPPPF